MSLDEFVTLMVGHYGDLDIMARGHPFSVVEIEEAMAYAEPDSQEMISLQVLKKHAQ